jgi:hypothetical protein
VRPAATQNDVVDEAQATERASALLQQRGVDLLNVEVKAALSGHTWTVTFLDHPTGGAEGRWAAFGGLKVVVDEETGEADVLR